MKNISLLTVLSVLVGCTPPETSNEMSSNTVRGINNPCIDNPNSGSSLCVDQNQNVNLIPPVEIAPVLPDVVTPPDEEM